MFFISLACLLTGFCLLCALSAIDLRTRLLPDKLTLPFLCTGIIFHFSTAFYYAPGWAMALGLITGGGLLYAVRLAANRAYNEDALGLGDVKLMAAGGVWLGPHDILLALVAGAMIGVFHGLGLAFYQRAQSGGALNLHALTLPAGPGFAAGLVIGGIIKFTSFFDLFF